VPLRRLTRAAPTIAAATLGDIFDIGGDAAASAATWLTAMGETAMLSARDALGPRFARALAAVPAPPLAPLLRPLDAARAGLLRIVAPRARGAVVSRDARVAIVGTSSLVLALVATCVRPLWVLALGPLIWGVPHLVADVRYLVARRALHKRHAAIAAAIVCSVGLASRLGVRAGLAAAAVAALASRASMARRVAIALACAALLAVAQRDPWKADVFFAQAHNLIAIVIWLAWRRRAALYSSALPLAAFAAGASVIALAPLSSWLASVGGADAPWTRLTLAGLGATLSLWSDPTVTLRLVLFFAFAQSAHYIVWLRLVPEEDRPRSAPRSFGQSLRALRGDVGGLALWLALAAIALLAVVAIGLRDVAGARDVYLGIAYFHGYLELIAVALLGAESRLGRRDACVS
jgi:hypothetical protein